MKGFILRKRRNQNDVDVIDKEVNKEINLRLNISHYLSEEEYNYLCKESLALPLRMVSGLLLSELFLRIIHNNGRALNELKYIIRNDKTTRSEYDLLKRACYAEFRTADAFRVILERHLKNEVRLDSIDLFSCLESKRSGKMLMQWSNPLFTREDTKKDIDFFKQLIEESPRSCFDFGIVKMTKNSNIRHIALCRRILLRYLARKYKQSDNEDDKTHIFDEGKREIISLKKNLHKMEDSYLKYSWLSMSLIYIECGKFLLLSDNNHDSDEALTMFENALLIEKSREAFWTRFTFQGYKGKVRCLLKLEKKDEAIQIVQKVTGELKGTNRDNVRFKLEQILKNSP